MKINKLSDIQEILASEKQSLAVKYGVSKIGVFGSFVFGDFTKKSDIDLLVEFSRSVGLFQFLDLQEYLSDKLGRKVDLVPKDSLKKYIKKDILKSTVYA